MMACAIGRPLKSARHAEHALVVNVSPLNLAVLFRRFVPALLHRYVLSMLRLRW